jgi:hypothetical protein
MLYKYAIMYHAPNQNRCPRNAPYLFPTYRQIIHRASYLAPALLPLGRPIVEHCAVAGTWGKLVLVALLVRGSDPELADAAGDGMRTLNGPEADDAQMFPLECEDGHGVVLARVAATDPMKNFVTYCPQNEKTVTLRWTVLLTASESTNACAPAAPPVSPPALGQRKHRIVE